MPTDRSTKTAAESPPLGADPRSAARYLERRRIRSTTVTTAVTSTRSGPTLVHEDFGFLYESILGSRRYGDEPARALRLGDPPLPPAQDVAGPGAVSDGLGLRSPSNRIGPGKEEARDRETSVRNGATLITIAETGDLPIETPDLPLRNERKTVRWRGYVRSSAIGPKGSVSVTPNGSVNRGHETTPTPGTGRGWIHAQESARLPHRSEATVDE
jgi:hypothetical protein